MESKFPFFVVGFGGGAFLTEMITKSYPKFGSIVIGLLFGLLYMELEKKCSLKHKEVKKK